MLGFRMQFHVTRPERLPREARPPGRGRTTARRGELPLADLRVGVEPIRDGVGARETASATRVPFPRARAIRKQSMREENAKTRLWLMEKQKSTHPAKYQELSIYGRPAADSKGARGRPGWSDLRQRICQWTCGVGSEWGR
jgi:hypothetical protein